MAWSFYSFLFNRKITNILNNRNIRESKLIKIAVIIFYSSYSMFMYFCVCMCVFLDGTRNWLKIHEGSFKVQFIQCIAQKHTNTHTLTLTHTLTHTHTHAAHISVSILGHQIWIGIQELQHPQVASKLFIKKKVCRPFVI